MLTRPERTLNNALKDLNACMEKTYELYHYLLRLPVELTHIQEMRLDEARNKYMPTEEDLNPNMKFINNRFALQLEANRQLQDFIAENKHPWDEEPEFVDKLLTQMEQTQFYQEYMASEVDDYDSDRELWRRLYRLLIQDNDDLDTLLEEKSLYWNDDKQVVDSFVLKTIKRFDEKNGSRQELLPEYDSEEEKDYARKLFRATILNADDYQRYMSEASRNWDFSRLAFMDVVIMQIAIAEMLTFPSIPLSVTINEFVELSKIYSTPRSFGYVNGMLDAIARHLVNSGKLMKQLEKENQEQ